MDCSTTGFPVLRQLQSVLKLTFIASVMPSNHFILCCPLLRPPSSFPSIWVLFSVSVFCIKWPKYWSFSFSISPSNEYSGLISFKMDKESLISLQSKGLSRVFSNTTVEKHHSSALNFFYSPTLTYVHDYWKNHSFHYKDLCW